MPNHTREISVGNEKALELEHGSSKMLFGLGPPKGPGVSTRRIRELLTALSPKVRALRWCDQVHGSEVVTVDQSISDPAACSGRHDGLITAEPGVGLMVWTADCVPLVLIGERVVAAIHAGWRGIAAGVIRFAVDKISAEFATTQPELSAFLGPAISPSRYPVGPEVIAALAQHHIPKDSWRCGDRVDLRGFLEAQLRSLGLQRVVRVGPCTAETPRLASYRRDGAAAGRQWTVVWMA
jgi:YfiH family protein